jgi:hypothetical protein
LESTPGSVLARAEVDRPLGPVGSFIDFTAKQVKESLGARITGRAT